MCAATTVAAAWVGAQWQTLRLALLALIEQTQVEKDPGDVIRWVILRRGKQNEPASHGICDDSRVRQCIRFDKVVRGG